MSFSGPIQASLVLPRNVATESESSYRGRLFNSHFFRYQVRIRASGQVTSGDTPIFDSGLGMDCDLPILAVQKTGPSQAQSGFTTRFGANLFNEGFAPAETIGVVDSVDGMSVQTSVVTPPTVEVAQTQTATIDYQIPLDHGAAPLTDTVQVTWKDQNGKAGWPGPI
jgi:hypothetical protein